MPNLISRPLTHADLLASTGGRVLIQTAPAAGAISGVASIVAAAGRGMLPGDRNAGTRRLALSAAEAAVEIVLCRIRDIINSRRLVSDENVDAIGDAADALEAAGDYAAAGKNDVVAESWYSLARKLNRDGFRAVAMCQHNDRQFALAKGF